MSKQPEGTPSSPATKPVVRKKRRWFRRLALGFAILLVLLLVVVGFAPQLAGLPPMRAAVLAIVNSKLRGTVRLDDYSLSWTGANELRGLRLADSQQRQVLSVARIAVSGGLWSLLASGLNFGTIELESPHVTLTLDEHNHSNLADALGAKVSGPAPENAPAQRENTGAGTDLGADLPALRGRLVIRDGKASVTRAGGAPVEAEGVACDFSVDTLADIRGSLELTLNRETRIAGQAAVKGLERGGKIDVNGASGVASLASDQPIDLAPLAAMFAPDLQLTGTLMLEGNATFGAGKVRGTVSLNAKSLRSEKSQGVQPLDAGLGGDFEVTSQAVGGNLRLESQAGGATVEFRADLSGTTAIPSADHLLAAALTGESIALPDFSLQAQGGFDLAAVDRAIPGLLRLSDGQRLTRGKLEVKQLTLRGGPSPSAGGEMSLSELEIKRGEQSHEPQPISFALDAGLVAGKGLELRKSNLKSVFVNIAAQGLASELSATIDVDLAKAGSELGAFLDVAQANLAGAVRGTFTVARTDAEHFETKIDLQGDALRGQFGGHALDLQHAALRGAGRLTLAAGTVARLETHDANVDLDGQFIATAGGWYDFVAGGFDAQASLKRIDLGFLGSRTGGVFGPQLVRYSGVLSGELQAARQAADQPLRTDGRIAASALLVDGRPLNDEGASLTWAGTQIAPGYRELRIERAQLRSAAAQIDASRTAITLGDQVELDLTLSGNADLARVFALLTPLLSWEKAPAIAGRLTLEGSAATHGPVVSTRLRSGIAGLTIGVGEQAVRQQQVDIALNGRVDNAAHKLSLESASVNAPLMNLELRGEIGELDHSPVAALTGKYDLAWEPLTQLMHEFAPATRDSVALAGRSASELRASGSFNDPASKPAFRGLRLGTQVGFGGATVYGVQLGGATLNPSLQDGMLVIPLAEIAAAGGKLRLGGTLDFTGDEATFVLSERTALLENVPVNRAVSEALLSRLNPVFAGLTQIDGSMSLVTTGVLVPFGDSLRARGVGRGRLDMKAVRLQPGGFMSELLSLSVLAAGAKKGETFAVQVSGCDFELHDGRLSYQDLTLKFPAEFDLQFHGSVGLDDTVDLIVSIPISAPLLERLGVSGAALQYAKDFSGGRIEVPLVGTRSQPRLDLAKVDVQPIVKKLLEMQAGGAVDDLLKGLGGKKKRP